MSKFAYFCWLLALPCGCLPKDTRPPPARVLFTATPSAATQTGALEAETADGWWLTFDRVLLSIGRASLDGDRCTVYSDARYRRVLSLVGAPNGQKLSDSYAVGSCDFGFGIANADEDALLGVGTTADDLAFLRTAGVDRYSGPSGISLFVAGRAQKDERALTFGWAFRGRARYDECENTIRGAVERGLTLSQDSEVTVDVTVHAEALFLENPEDHASPLRFDAIASADELGNRDGDVSLDELRQVPLTDLQSDTAYRQAEGSVGVWTDLEDFVYLGAAPRVARFQGTGKCNLRLGNRRDD